MAYVFPLNVVYASKEGGVETYRLVPRELVPRERGISSRPETPEPDESIEGTVIERSPTPPSRPDTPERLTVTPGWKAFTQRASQAELGNTNTNTGVLLGDPECQDGWVDDSPSNNRPSSSPWAHTSLAGEAVSQTTFPTESYAVSSPISASGDEGLGHQHTATVSAQSTTAPISTPIQSNSISPPASSTTPSLPGRSSAGGTSTRDTSDGGQVIASNLDHVVSVQTLAGALRQSTLDEYFERLTFGEGSSGSVHGGTSSRGQFTATGHARIASAETSSASDSAILTPSGSPNVSCNNGRENRATLPLRQAQSITEDGRTPAPSLRFNLEHAATLLSSNDAYMGSVLPTIPGTTEYLVDENGSRLSSREAIHRHGETHVARFLDAHRRGISTAQGRAEVELQFTRLRNLYHFTASPHLILVADWYDQFLTSFDEPSLWDIYPDDTPATSFP